MAVYFYFGLHKIVHLILKTDGEYEAMKMIYILTVTENCYTAMLLSAGREGKNRGICSCQRR